jgi:hypothetical protein
VKLLPWIGLLAAAALATACNKAADKAEAPMAPSGPVVERTGAVTWDAASGAFMLKGKPLKAAKLWTFDGSTEGFTGVGSKVAPAAGQGLAVTVADPSLRSPKGLNVPGGEFPMVVVRLTRVGAGDLWDGGLYYTTPQHPEAIGFLGKPVGGTKPGLNETVTLVYDMSHQAAGAGDWQRSMIDQIRLDIEDKPGGRFVIHQVAITENPDAAPAPAATPAAAPPPAPAPKP